MILSEGKTKVIRRADEPARVFLETKDELTGGDAAKRETIAGIAVHKTTQASNVFRFLESRGIPTAFVDRHDDRSLLCHACRMLPLELVTRRYAWGSFLKREPDLVSTHDAPHRFDQLRLELYHKNAVVMPPLVNTPVQMSEDAARERYLRDGMWAQGVFTDPLIQISAGRWLLHSAKAPIDDSPVLMETEAMLDGKAMDSLLGDIMTPTFLALEEAWSSIETVGGPVALVDMKIEVGYRESDGRLVVADVIDNDSWRIWPGGDPRKQLDKQVFREDHPLAQVAENYALVAALTEQF